MGKKIAFADESPMTGQRKRTVPYRRKSARATRLKSRNDMREVSNQELGIRTDLRFLVAKGATLPLCSFVMFAS